MAHDVSAVYTRAFFQHGRTGAERSAAKIVPVLMDLVSPTSVVDIGCGIGIWARTFQLNGLQDILGVDGSYIPRDALQIDEKQFLSADLSEPLSIKRTFDLAVTLEVAEHLPVYRAKTFVRDLVRLAPAVAFSAAIPGQGGTNHVNEQWPDYWQALFAECGYGPIDLRLQFWDDSDIEIWYRQNLILFIDNLQLRRYPKIKVEGPPSRLRRLVHPGLYLRNASILNFVVSKVTGWEA